jgi:myo-inositol-1-phosphate synthase
VRQHRSVHEGRAAHQSIETFEKALEANESVDSVHMVNTYAALMEEVPFANGAPNLSVDVPAMMALAQQTENADLRQGLQDGQPGSRRSSPPA